MPATSEVASEESPLVHPITGERLVYQKRARDTGGAYFELSVYMAPGGFVSAAHVHPHQEERFVISGAELVFRVGGLERIYKPGETAVVPAGKTHTWWNPSKAGAVALVRLTPALDSETMLETFFGLASDGKVNARGLPNPLQAAVLLRDFRRELELPGPVGWVVGKASIAIAPLARLLGYRSRYDKYSGSPAGKPRSV
jgi:quercetin dioxygenase-like cupin family protein